MAKGNPAKVPFTKEEYLQMRLDGKTRTKIYTEFKIHPPDFYAWLEEQGLKDKQVEDQLVEELRLRTAETTEAETVDVVDPVGNQEDTPEVPGKEPEPVSEPEAEPEPEPQAVDKPADEQLHTPTQLEREEMFASEEERKPKRLFNQFQKLIAGEGVILQKDERDRMKLALDLLGLEYEMETFTVIKLRRPEECD